MRFLLQDSFVAVLPLELMGQIIDFAVIVLVNADDYPDVFLESLSKWLWGKSRDQTVKKAYADLQWDLGQAAEKEAEKTVYLNPGTQESKAKNKLEAFSTGTTAKLLKVVRGKKKPLADLEKVTKSAWLMLSGPKKGKKIYQSTLVKNIAKGKIALEI